MAAGTFQFYPPPLKGYMLKVTPDKQLKHMPNNFEHCCPALGRLWPGAKHSYGSCEPLAQHTPCTCNLKCGLRYSVSDYHEATLMDTFVFLLWLGLCVYGLKKHMSVGPSQKHQIQKCALPTP